MPQSPREVGRAQPEGGARVAVEGLAKRYTTDVQHVVALDGVTFIVEPGSLVAVMGPSGSGKSTLLHLIGAMDDADEGVVTVGEYKVTSLSRRDQPGYRRRIGFVFQRFHLLPALTALDNVAAPLLPHRVDFDKHERAAELLAAVGLGGREDALPSELSGGQQQRVAIARALVNEPQLLFADEPTGNLDSKTSEEILRMFQQLNREDGLTIILVTHEPDVARYAQRIIHLKDGRID